jgi:hypothetical protein
MRASGLFDSNSLRIRVADNFTNHCGGAMVALHATPTLAFNLMPIERLRLLD